MSASDAAAGTVLALSGGIGGAKLALGLARVLPPELLTVVANTGDDFEHLGLAISPDLDTLLYTLAGLDNPETRLGPRGRDLDLHGGAGGARRRDLVPARRRAISRCTSSARGGSRPARRLSAITARSLPRGSASRARILPMTDDPVRTRVRHRRGPARLPGLFRAPPVRAGRARDRVRRRRDRAAAARSCSRRWPIRTCARCHLPVQSVHQHRADPGRARRARGARGTARRRSSRSRRSSAGARSRARRPR